MTPDARDTSKKPPAAPQGDHLLEHDYDGIQEYDNPMPRWWLMTFAGTVVFSVVYLFNIGPVGNGKGRIADYEAEMAKQAALHPVVADNVSDEMLVALAADPAVKAAGKQVFTTNCVACHGPEAGGLIGPNLTDEYWLHGSHLSEIHKTVTEGVLAKGMPPWGKMLTPKQVNAVVVYVASLKGTHPANPKAPQGTSVTP